MAQFTTTTAPTFWVDGDSISSSGGIVSAWVDKTGNASLNIVGGAPTVVPAPGTGNNAVSFNGTSDFLANTTVAGSTLFSDTATTIFIVENDLSLNSSSVSFSWVGDTASPGTGHQAVAAINDAGNIVFNQGSNGSDLIQGAKPTDNNYHVLGLQRNDAGSSSISVDGSGLSTSGAFAGGSVTTATPSQLTIGATANPGGSASLFFNGTIAEILVFNYALNSTETASVENYLGGKYGISVVPEPSQYATVFGVICVLAGVAVRVRRQQNGAAV